MSCPFGQFFPLNPEFSIKDRNTLYKWLVTCFEILYMFGDKISFVVSQLTGSFSGRAISRTKIWPKLSSRHSLILYEQINHSHCNNKYYGYVLLYLRCNLHLKFLSSWDFHSFSFHCGVWEPGLSPLCWCVNHVFIFLGSLGTE